MEYLMFYLLGAMILALGWAIDTYKLQLTTKDHLVWLGLTLMSWCTITVVVIFMAFFWILSKIVYVEDEEEFE